MPDKPRPQPPEATLLQKALEQDGRSIRTVAEEAGMSDARWRQIVKGSMTTGGHTSPVVAPPATLARMALVVGVSPARLREVGREDAAEAVELLQRTPKPQTSMPPARRSATAQTDEIELVYASTTMTAAQKLETIRKILMLRAEVESEQQASAEARVRSQTSA